MIALRVRAQKKMPLELAILYDVQVEDLRPVQKHLPHRTLYGLNA
jgi:hypothetical protein